MKVDSYMQEKLRHLRAQTALDVLKLAALVAIAGALWQF